MSIEDTETRKILSAFPWVRIATMMLGVVTVAVGPLWASHLHLLKEFAHTQELATNPNARPDAYTGTRAELDKQYMREWVVNKLALTIAELRQDMPPAGWRRRIRVLERQIMQCESIDLPRPPDPGEFPDD